MTAWRVRPSSADFFFNARSNWSSIVKVVRFVCKSIRQKHQDVTPVLCQTRDHYFSLAVRTGQDAGALLPVLASALQQLDPNLAVSNEETINEQIDRTQAALLHQFSAWLVGGFAAMALVLGVVGLYGVVAYSVSQRTREIGVPMALGAQRSSVYQLILKEAGWLTTIGIALGLVCSVGAATLMRGMLFGTQPWDVATLSAVGAVLAVSALLASYIPARRATKVDPMVALRYE